MRQGAVLQPDDEDLAELQSFRAVQAHEPHLVARVALVGVASTWGEDSPWMELFYNARAWVG